MVQVTVTPVEWQVLVGECPVGHMIRAAGSFTARWRTEGELHYSTCSTFEHAVEFFERNFNEKGDYVRNVKSDCESAPECADGPGSD